MSIMKKRLDQINTDVDRYMNDIESFSGNKEIMLHYVSDHRRKVLIDHHALIDSYQWWESLRNKSAVTN
jgi:hypothetical protein